jgi:hypothetical protein
MLTRRFFWMTFPHLTQNSLRVGVKPKSITPTAKSGETGSRAASTAQQEGGGRHDRLRNDGRVG